MVIRRFASFYCVLCTGRICITNSDLRFFAGNEGCYHSGALHFLAGRFILNKNLCARRAREAEWEQGRQDALETESRERAGTARGSKSSGRAKLGRSVEPPLGAVHCVPASQETCMERNGS